MDTKHDSGTPTRRRARQHNDHDTQAPPDVIAVLRRGGTAALVCAAASSAVSLFWLAILVGWPAPLAWLLPACLDVYAGTSLYVGYRLPVTHRAAASVRRNARFALALSVACNGIYHALVLFGAAWPYWVHDSLLVLVSALPPIVVERLLHLRSKIGAASAAAESGTAAPALAPAPTAPPGTTPGSAAPAAAAGGRQQNPASPALPPPLPVAEPGTEPGNAGKDSGGNVVALNGSDRRPPAAWAELALPLYRRHVADAGTPPTANTLVQMLRDAHPDLRVPASERSARNIRSATEALATGDGAAEESEPDREWASA